MGACADLYIPDGALPQHTRFLFLFIHLVICSFWNALHEPALASSQLVIMIATCWRQVM
jgi:hypothetical protein